ncbi:hypothetical protein SAMN04244573_03221 [Azotobacter beijerinckii]|uniref:Uncharacterized protein n=1 Tax=Azotobacter beijerinckii TaxID=170623 RepID=A0A1H9MQD0_9GAMM|nr:hypothetical protein [Azotobacter beijerinckii]SER25697.1 hypothetical protein SAMN04244573_03221 [Azotobacter beijerinckii]
MALLGNYTGKSNFQAPEISISADGVVQAFIIGTIGKGEVRVALDIDGAGFHEYPELIFSKRTTFELNVKAGDKLKFSFINCTDAGAKVRM